jgi:hypothetical protein
MRATGCFTPSKSQWYGKHHSMIRSVIPASVCREGKLTSDVVGPASDSRK